MCIDLVKPFSFLAFSAFLYIESPNNSLSDGKSDSDLSSGIYSLQKVLWRSGEIL